MLTTMQRSGVVDRCSFNNHRVSLFFIAVISAVPIPEDPPYDLNIPIPTLIGILSKNRLVNEKVRLFHERDFTLSLGLLAVGICSKYWYLVVLLVLIILAAIGCAIGFAVFRSRSKGKSTTHLVMLESTVFVAGCSLSCGPSEKLVRINSTYCDCQCKWNRLEHFSLISFRSID